MFVMRELYGELSFVFCFGGLARSIRIAENKAPGFARRGAHVTNRANRRAGTSERLAREKLLSVTTNAGIMIWEVRYVGKVTLRRPLGGDLVTGIAG